MSRPTRTSLDPKWFADGQFAEQHHVTLDDEMPSSPEAAHLVVAALVERLPEPDRSAVQMAVMSGMSYRETAEVLGVKYRKTVWRWAQRGLERLRGWMEDSEWMRVMLAEHVDGFDDGPALQTPGTHLHDVLDIGGDDG